MRRFILLTCAIAIGLSLRASAEVVIRPKLPLPASRVYQPVPMILSPKASHTPVRKAPELPAELLLQPVTKLFTPDEAENLKQLGAADLAFSLKLVVASPASADTLKAWCRKHYPGWVVETNNPAEIHALGDEPDLKYQWGLKNIGTSQGFALDTHRVAELPAEPGQDVGALRARPEQDSTPARAPTIVAVLDTGLDYDRDVSGRITGGHSEFIGQVIDKTGKGDECDPGDPSKPEQMLEGPRGRRARFKACIAQPGRTDCLSVKGPDGRPDFDRDQNGYPLDCLGWNLTAALTKPADPAHPGDPLKPTDFFRATDLAGDDNTVDKLGHGTHVAGIIAAAADGVGTRGVVTKNVAILPVKVVDRAPNQPIIPQEIDCKRLGGPENHNLLDLSTDGDSEMCQRDTIDTIVRSLVSIPERHKKIRTAEQLLERQAELEEAGPFAPPPPEGEAPIPQEKLLNPEKVPLGFTDLIARGMLYAIRSKANVISMSLAWPSDADSELMKRLTQLARDNGILVVASAGNDSAEARTMPCQYSSVICVGSHAPSGALSYFSNYGAAVDVAAPGQNILSTWPRSLKGGRKWTEGPVGYEQKSGTSMAAPMVAGVLARLLNDGFNPDDAQARLYAGTRALKAPEVCQSHQPAGSTLCADPANLHPAVRTGNVDLPGSEQAQEAPIIMPDPKGPVTVNWDPSSDTARFSIRLKNYWSAAVDARVELELETEEEPTLAGTKIEMTSASSFQDWAKLDSRTIEAQLRFPGDEKARLKLNGRFFVNVKITTSNSAPRSFEVPFELVATIDSAHPFPRATEFPIDGNPVFNGDILTIVPKDGTADLEYMALDADPEGLTMRLFREQPVMPPLAPHFAEVAKATVKKIPNATRLADIQRVDHTAGEKSGYVLIWETKPADGNISGLRFDFFNHDLEYLEKRLLRYDNIVSGIDDQHWAWMKHGTFKVPAWVSFGLLPKEEYPDPDFYGPFYTGQSDEDYERAFEALRKKAKVNLTREQGRRVLLDSMKSFGQDHFQRNHFYYLEPFERKEHDPITGAETGEVKAIAHTGAVNPMIPDYRGIRVRGERLVRPPDFHTYVPVAMLNQTAEERRAGSVRLLLATPEKNEAGREMATLRYAIGTVSELKSNESNGDRSWIIDYTAELLQPDETKNLAGLPDVMTMIPLGLKSQLDPRGTFMGQALDRGMYEANTVVPGTRKAIATRNDGVSRVEVSIPTINNFPVSPPAPTDSVFHATGAFLGSDGRLAMFGETHYDLQYNDLKTHERAATSLGRFSYMPQAAVSKSLMSVVVRKEEGGDLLPAMLIPAQIRSSANLEVIIPSYSPATGKLDRLITPARLRIQAGQGCRALKLPTQATEQTGPALMFLCDGKFVQVPLAY